MAQGIYKFSASIASPGAVTLLQLKTGTTKPIEIIRAWCTQHTSTTSGQVRIQILRKTGAATVTTGSGLLYPLDATSPTSSLAVGTTSTGFTASGEGTDGNVLIDDAFNILNGWLYLPVPEERIKVAANGDFLAIKFPTATVPTATYEVGIIWQEL